MSFYDNTKEERARIAKRIYDEIDGDLKSGDDQNSDKYFSDEDTYIRKAGYLAIGKIYFQDPGRLSQVTVLLERLWKSADFRVRQTVINAAGEVGKKDFEHVSHLFDKGLFDPHHSVRNAVIGSVKKMGEKNPAPVLTWAKQYLRHADKEIRREICHGIELRGRKHPEDILPLLKELQHDKESRVRNTLVHVIGQISYKKGCLERVLDHLKTWDNRELVADALDEIVDVHERYSEFAALGKEEVLERISREYFTQRSKE